MSYSSFSVNLKVHVKQRILIMKFNVNNYHFRSTWTVKKKWSEYPKQLLTVVDLISTEINPNINYLPITHIVEQETAIPTILKTFIDINFKNTCSNYFLWVQKTFLGESHLCKNLILENFGESRTHLDEMQGSLNLYVLTGYIGYTMYRKLS